MKSEDQIRLQAYLDNEVSSSEARQIATWLARDSEAKALYNELAGTKSALIAENELAVAVPESREFYWSKIQRGIERAEQEPVRSTPARPWWIRLLAPVAGAAMLALFVFTSISFNPTRMIQADLTEQSHVENGTLTLRSPGGGMTIVWITSSASDAPESASRTDIAAEPDDDDIF